MADAGANTDALRRYSLLTAGMALLLILAGGFVTTTATGDSISQWPMMWGKIAPGFHVEWTHRALAIVVGLMVLGLAIATHRLDTRPWVRRLALAALAGVVVQALIGGLRIYVPKAAVSILHACFGQAVFCSVVAVALVLSKSWSSIRPDEEAWAARGAGLATVAVCFLQLVAGAVTRHTGGGILVHVGGAVAVLTVASLFGSGLMSTPFRRGGLLLMSILGLQILLGLLSWSIIHGGFVRSHLASVLPVVTITSHVAGGALLLATSLVLTLKCRRSGPEVDGATEATGKIRKETILSGGRA